MHPYPEINEQATSFFFLFPFCCRRDSDTNPCEIADAIIQTPLSDLLCMQSLPQALKDRKPSKDDNIWLPKDASVSEDLHPHIALILGRTEHSTGNEVDPRGLRAHGFYELTSEARNVLSGGWGKRGLGFEITISTNARRRLGIPLGKPISIRALIDAAYLQFFRSGIGVLIIECSYRCDTDDLTFAEVILEANYQLCRAGNKARNSLVWANINQDEAESNEHAFSLNEFANALVTCSTIGGDSRRASQLQQIEWMTKTRVFSYSAVQFKHSFEDGSSRRAFAYRLCNKHTSDYSVRQESIDMALVPTFDNVLHGAAIEGGCVVVEEADVDFLKSYVRNVGRKVYLTLALVSFHEFRHLLLLTQESAMYISSSALSEHDIAQLRRLRHDLINIHLFFRFSHASMIGLHNIVHQAWRKAFGLDRMLDELTADVAEAEKVLSEEVHRLAEAAESQKEQRWRIWSTVATWVGAYFTISHVLEIWVRTSLFESQLTLMTLKVYNNLATMSEFETLQHQIHLTEMLLEGIAVVTAIAIAVFVYRNGPKSSTKSRHGH